MKLTHKLSENQEIAYKINKSNSKKPTIVFIHGLMSSMESSKAVFLHEFCEKEGLNYIRFDNLGSGDSSGDFSMQNMSSWIQATESIIKDLCPNGVILVGSSKGGWLALLITLRYQFLVKGLVTIAAAPDFTKDIWSTLDKSDRNMLKSGEKIDFSPNEIHTYPIRYKLFEDAEQYFLLNKEIIPITCKVRMLHGQEDKSVPYQKSLDVLSKLKCQDAMATIVKDGDHSLSEPNHLELLTKNILDIL